MKRRKRLAAVALTLAVFFSLGVNAYAEELPAPTTEETTQTEIEQSTSIPEEVIPPAEDPPVTEEQETDVTPPEPITVFSLEELTAAIDTAEDGNTIFIATPITIHADAVIGATDKTIVFKPSDEYKPVGLFDCTFLNGNNITFQNVVLDGAQIDWKLNAAITCSQYASGEESVWNFENVVFKNLNCTGSVVDLRNADAYFDKCQFIDNYGMSCGALNVQIGCSAKIIDCIFSGNSSDIRGGAISCYGAVEISKCTITDNKSTEEDSGYGGGIYVSPHGYCNVNASEIARNKANNGGGIYNEGVTTLTDTLIHTNSAKIGGDDIYCHCFYSFSADYTTGVKDIYTEDSNPIGFYLDDQGTRFDSATNAKFIGDSISIQPSQVGLIGLKFIFQNDLPPMTAPPAPVVNSFDALQTAISNSSDGDTIYISNKMICSESAVIGSPDKVITLKLADAFISDSLFYLFADEGQNIIFQNLILSGAKVDGKRVFAVTGPFSSALTDSKSSWSFDNVTFEDFYSNTSVVTIVPNVSAVFTNCNFENNFGRRSGGIEINPDSSAEIQNCTFSNNQSGGNGAAIQCRGQASIAESIITQNTALNDGTVKNGGGICVDEGASCEVLSCTITGNTADLGGGISCMGTLTLCDTLLYGNTGNLGGSDIRGFRDANIVVDYTDNMNAIYTENSPVGFYKDDFESTFNAETNAEFIGESFSIQANDNMNFGVKFIFEGDLPQEKPSDPIPVIPAPPVIEIIPVPTPDSDPQPTPAPAPIPVPPIDPPEESKDAEEIPPSDYEEEQSTPVVSTDDTEQKPEAEMPPVTTTDNNSATFEETEQDKQPVQETVAEEDSVVDSSAPDVDNDTETEISELPIEDEAVTETMQPKQEKQTTPVMIDKDEERSAPWGIIIAVVTLLSASGAIWFIKRKR